MDTRVKSNYYKKLDEKLEGAKWRDIVTKIKQERDELQEYYGMMSPYERSVIERGINSLIEDNLNSILHGIAGEYHQALTNYLLLRIELVEIAKITGKEIDKLLLSSSDKLVEGITDETGV